MDHDIKVSLHNTKNAETALGSESIHMQAESDLRLGSDPICSSAGCNQYKHLKKDPGYDMDYPVPDLGVDRDIIANHEDTELAERLLKHKLNLGTEESKKKWENPAKKTEYDYSPRLEDDMIDSAYDLDLVENQLHHKYEPWTF